MKKICIIFLTLIIISVTALGLSGIFSENTQNGGGRYEANLSKTDNEYLRIHIRADSNEPQAQAVKYRVRDEIVKSLTPLVAEYKTQAQAINGVGKHLSEIEKTAICVLREQGCSYGATAELTVEKFPTRVYGEYILPAGEYAAIILRLGRGEGDNWWCVVYPPLCFVGAGENIVYKSKIVEIIENFRKKK